MGNRINNPDWSLRRGFTPPQVGGTGDGHDGTRHTPGSPYPVIPRVPPLGAHLATVKHDVNLADYVDTTYQVPLAVSRPHPGFGWGMLANDTLGDCVCAMMLHSIEDWHLDAGTPVPAFTDQDAISWYSEIGGYVVGDPSTDQGCDEDVAMGKWKGGELPETSDGVLHQAAGTIGINPKNTDLVKRAIAEFADVQLAIELPITAQGQTEWDVVGDPNHDDNSKPGSWGGHGIPGREYDAHTVKVVTWGAELLMTWGMFGAYVVQSFAVASKEMLNKSGVGPSGVQWDDLTSDLAKQMKARQGKKKPAPKKAD